jgi:hypothetical protein
MSTTRCGRAIVGDRWRAVDVLGATVIFMTGHPGFLPFPRVMAV